MNKTLLLVICDFLLLSMLALARFDPPEEPPEPSLNATANSSTVEAEVISLLEESLQAEQTSRSGISEDLAAARETLADKARQLENRDAALAKTREALENKSAEAEERAHEQRRLAEEKAKLAAEREKLSQQFEKTREALDTEKSERLELTQTLGQLKEERAVANERLTHTEEALIAREIALAEREAALRASEEEKKRLAAERETLSRELEVARTEQRLLAQNLAQEQQEKNLLQTEKEQAFARADRLGEGVSQLGQGVSALGQNMSQLGEGVSSIAETSERIEKEIEESKPQTMSQIFTRFQDNRATLRFTSTEKTMFGGTTVKTYDTKSILISDSSNYYLVTHSSNTPFNLSKSTSGLSQAAVEISLGDRSFSVGQIGFLNTDPRIIFIPLPKQYVESSGLKTFELAKNPERWEEAVLVKHDESNFGRTDFRRLTSSERILQMDRPALGQLFSEFASSRGDLAFTKNAQFIGVLTDAKHAIVIRDFLASGVLNLGNNFDPTTAAETLDRLKDRVRTLPPEIQ